MGRGGVRFSRQRLPTAPAIPPPVYRVLAVVPAGRYGSGTVRFLRVRRRLRRAPVAPLEGWSCGEQVFAVSGPPRAQLSCGNAARMAAR